MEENNVKFGYGKELEGLSKVGEGLFKPGTGIFKILFMSEPEHVIFHSEKDNKDVEQIKLSVRVDDELAVKSWFVGKSKTTKGIFMQLMLIGQNMNGLKGNTVTLMVSQQQEKNGTYKNTYMVQEALPFIKKVNDKK